jgi:hypothetical protein
MKAQMRSPVDLSMGCIRIPRGENCKKPSFRVIGAMILKAHNAKYH